MGNHYEEESRYRIEAICLRRELNFLTKQPDSGHLREEIARTLEWCATIGTISPMQAFETATTKVG